MPTVSTDWHDRHKQKLNSTSYLSGNSGCVSYKMQRYSHNYFFASIHEVTHRSSFKLVDTIVYPLGSIRVDFRRVAPIRKVLFVYSILSHMFVL